KWRDRADRRYFEDRTNTRDRALDLDDTELRRTAVGLGVPVPPYDLEAMREAIRAVMRAYNDPVKNATRFKARAWREMKLQPARAAERLAVEQGLLFACMHPEAEKIKWRRLAGLVPREAKITPVEWA